MARNPGVPGGHSGPVSGPSLRELAFGPELALSGPEAFKSGGRLQARFPGAMRQRALSAADGSGSSSWPGVGPAEAFNPVQGQRANLYRWPGPETRRPTP